MFRSHQVIAEQPVERIAVGARFSQWPTSGPPQSLTFVIAWNLSTRHESTDHLLAMMSVVNAGSACARLETMSSTLAQQATGGRLGIDGI